MIDAHDNKSNLTKLLKDKILPKKAEASSARVQGDSPTGVQGARHDCLMRGLYCRASVKRLRDEAENIEEEAGNMKGMTLSFCPV